ncbi:MAG: DNA cytosine methyltransferase [Termitinemataceae bacterium]|nr:MAG: DNA cytosine methyltransferase [Termitinemataceae bacterium]
MKNKMNYTQPYIVDLFCGIGGLTHGLLLSGLNVIAGIDIDESCKYAYETNNKTIFITADISELSSEKIKNLYPKNQIKVLVGCAPCQPFSRYSIRYQKKGYTDNKWKLLYSFKDKIENICPEIVSMENVPELSKKTIFKDFEKTLINMGYHVSWKVAYCPDYGVPQKRRRLVLLASMFGDISLIPPQCTPDNYFSVRDAIGSLPPIEAGQALETDILHCSAALSKTNIKRIKKSGPGGTWRDWSKKLQLTCHKKASGGTYPSVYGRMYWDEPSPTITTQFFGYGNGRFGHPEQNRALSIREGAILQSFPTDYVFIKPNEQISKRELGIHIGNAVPVNLGKAIGESIKKHIMEVRQDGK